MMGRPFDKHIDEQELELLASWCAIEDQGGENSRPASIGEAERHLASCDDCTKKLAQYRQIAKRMNVSLALTASTPAADCPADIDWHEVAAGLWPETRAQELITHAARCAHCGPILRAAASAEASPEEEAFLAELKVPFHPALKGAKKPSASKQLSRTWRRLMDWKVLVPMTALLVVVAGLGIRSSSSSHPVSGMELAEFAAATHQEHERGNLALEIQTDSQPQLNEWLHGKSLFSLALPASSEVPSEQLPYRIEGARLVQIRNKTAVYIAYQMQPDDVSLIVAPVSVAIASGGIEAAFKKVTFHYYTIENYKIVTWSVHGLTYALVSQEGNKTQRSCMVCHSAMRDRDLSRTPSPLPDQKKTTDPVWH